MKILAIETSCDETAIALVQASEINGEQVSFEALANAINSQIEKHREYGGVFPNLARREHAKNLIPLLETVFKQSNLSPKNQMINNKLNLSPIKVWLEREPELCEEVIEFAEKYQSSAKGNIDAIAVTAGPGLAPALWIGINVARSLAHLWDIPLVAVNHMAGHVLSGLYPNQTLQTPALALLVSGGHTEIDLVESPTEFKRLGSTVDDAAGEAFDKVARMIGLPYPGGPEISKLASEHRDTFPDHDSIYDLPRPMEHSGDLKFSFSGLKTAVKRIVDKNPDFDEEFISTISREFEDSVVDILIKKLRQAIKDDHPNQILVGGGVIANKHLRQSLQDLADELDVKLLLSPHDLTGDNAVMIAMSGYYQACNKDFINPQEIIARSNWPIDQ